MFRLLCLRSLMCIFVWKIQFHFPFWLSNHIKLDFFIWNERPVAVMSTRVSLEHIFMLLCHFDCHLPCSMFTEKRISFHYFCCYPILKMKKKLLLYLCARRTRIANCANGYAYCVALCTIYDASGTSHLIFTEKLPTLRIKKSFDFEPNKVHKAKKRQLRRTKKIRKSVSTHIYVQNLQQHRLETRKKTFRIKNVNALATQKVRRSFNKFLFEFLHIF